MQEKGDYIDWYCSGIRGAADMDDELTQGYVCEGFVTDEIRHDLLNHVEINLINNIQQICSKLSKFGNCFVVQDLDNYGIEKYFNYKLLETKD